MDGLFEIHESNERESSEDQSLPAIVKEKRNLLDRNRAQLIRDQREDVTLSKLKVLDQPPLGIEGYFYLNEVLMHRKISKYPHNGQTYVDRVVVPEVYRPEMSRLGHSIPLAGHMGQEKTYERIAMHFFGPGCIVKYRSIVPLVRSVN